MKTSPLVKFGLYNLELNPLSTASYSEGIQPFSDLTDFQRGDDARVDYRASYEEDFWLLDGTYKVSSTAVGIVGTDLSQSNSALLPTPVLTIEFSEPVSSDGLVLHFAQHSGDYCSELQVDYYDENDDLISSEGYNPDGVDFSTGLAVADFVRIEITFINTSKPGRYLRLSAIDYGTLVYFDEDSIKSATVVEQVDPSGLSMPANSFELSVYSPTGMFNPLNPDGAFEALQSRQPFDVYELVDADRVYLGRFYLDDWDSPSDKIATFYCVDAITLLAGVEFTDKAVSGAQDGGNSIRNIAARIEELSGFQVMVDDDIPFTTIRAFKGIRNSDARLALQTATLCSRTIATCSRSAGIRIVDSVIAVAQESSDFVVDPGDLGYDRKPKLRKLVTGASVTNWWYAISGSTTLMVTELLQPGTYTYKFNEADLYPNYFYSIDNGTIVERGGFFITFTLTVAAVVTITVANLVNKSKQPFSVSGVIPTGAKQNVIVVSDTIPALAGPSNSTPSLYVPQHLLDYFGQRYELSVKLFSPGFGVTGTVDVGTSFNRTLRGMVEQMTIDLVGGFVADAKVVGGLL